MSSPVLRAPSRAALACLLALLLPASQALAEPGIRILNSLATQDLALNALTTNREALWALTTGPLSTEAFATDGRLKHQLLHPPARQVMKYLVECALPEDHAVRWGGYIYKGSAGLCPEWAYGAPSLECQGYVTACLLARNNAYGLAVELSLRGEDARAPLRFNPSGAAVEWSPMFLPCAAGGVGLGAECGWLGEGVGTCTPGATVTVAAGAPLSGTCTGKVGDISGDRVLRVCKDPAGCTRAERLAEADRNPCGGIAPSATFTCPADGRYSVMSAPYSRAAAPGTWVRPQATSGTYPAGPFGAFTFREGAFFGNLFDPAALTVDVVLDPAKDYQPVLQRRNFQGYPYLNVHACHGRDWVSGDDHLASRICARATIAGERVPVCLARSVGPCEPGSTSSLPPKCGVNDGHAVLGDGDFESCRDTAGWPHPEPITVFLRSPCDVLSPQARQVCTTTCSALACTAQCRPKTPGECLQKYTAPQQ